LERDCSHIHYFVVVYVTWKHAKILPPIWWFQKYRHLIGYLKACCRIILLSLPVLNVMFQNGKNKREDFALVFFLCKTLPFKPLTYVQVFYDKFLCCARVYAQQTTFYIGQGELTCLNSRTP
jgi:hypothetical protein